MLLFLIAKVKTNANVVEPESSVRTKFFILVRNLLSCERDLEMEDTKYKLKQYAHI